jgi:translocation and assembly module TamB
MTRGQRIAIRAGILGGSVLLVLMLGLLVLTQTDWGRERVRGFAVTRLDAALDGHVSVGRLSGNLLRRWRLADVTIVDSEGRPFIAADTVATRFSLRGLIRRRIELHDVELIRARVVLDQPPGERWNYVRILPESDPDPTRRGWGDWIRLDDVVIVGSRITIQSEWKPDPELPAADRARKIADALDGDGRANIQEVPGGYQNVMDFRQITARLEEVVLADPDTDRMVVDVAALRAIAQPFRPPLADVRALEGRFYISNDSIWFQDVRARLPGSRLVAAGAYHLESADLILRMNGDPAALPDLRWLYPALPEEGGGQVRLSVHRRQAATRILAEDMDLRVGDGSLAGDLRLVVGDTFRILPTEVRFADLDSRPVDRMIPGLELPVHGVLDGRLALRGNPASMQVEADVSVRHAATGRSRVTAEGVVALTDPVRFTGLHLAFRPLRTDLVRGHVPRLPRGAAITGQTTLDGPLNGPLQLDADLIMDDPATGRSRVMASGGLDPRPPGLRFANLDLQFQPLRADLVRPEVPQLPAGATIAGRLRLDGPTTGVLGVDGDLTLRDPITGESRVAGAGGVRLGGDLAFQDLDLRLAPLQVAALRLFQPDLPLAGTLTGTARLDGRPGGRMAVSGDLVHLEGDQRSNVAGSVTLLPDGPTRVDVQLRPLSLNVAGRFVPGAGLVGQVHGHLRAAGDPADLSVRADLTVAGGGEIQLEGRLDLAGSEPAYDLTARTRAFDLAAVTVHAPAATDLTGIMAAHGRGMDPATMQTGIRADLSGSSAGDLAADEVRLRAGVAEGLARVDSSTVRLGPLVAWADGEFGLVGWRDGELRYRVHLDELAGVAPVLPPADTGVVGLRPPVRRAALEEARAAARQAERRRLVEAIATGRTPPPPAVPFDTLALAGIPRDSVAGRLDAVGVLRGNVQIFDILGRVEVDELVIQGHRVGRGQAEYTWIRRGVARPIIELDAEAERLVIEGFALDSATAQIRHRGDREGSGQAVLAAWQDDDTDYHADVEFTLALDRGELLLHDLDMRFDTLVWESVRPGAVRWNGDGVEVAGLELVSDQGGRIYVHGRLPVDGNGDLHLVMREVELAHLGLILQDDSRITGRISLEGRMEGTLQVPRFEGVGTVVDAGRNGRSVPDARLAVTYGARELTVQAELFEEAGRTFAIAEATVPIDLALADRAGSRLLDGPITVDVTADSLPLDGVGALTDELQDVRGVAAGELSVRGALDSPEIAGQVTVRDAEFRLTATGVRYRDVAGTFSLSGSELVVDSLVARAGGPLRASGTVDLGTPDRPGFDLTVVAENAWAMNTRDVQLRIDADLEIAGPFDRVAITGQARTRRGVIYVPETRGKAVVTLDDPALLQELEGRLLAAAEELIDAPSPLLANLEVDVDLFIEPDTWIRSTDYNVEVYTPPDLGPLRVELDQAAGRLTLEGTVNSDRGQYTFMGRRFVVTRGAATFIGTTEIDPLIQVTAEHEVQLPGREDFSIRVILGGTLLRPTLTVESNARPPIPDTDIFTYIALGRSADALLQQQQSGLSGAGDQTGDLVGNVAGLATMQMSALAANTLLDEFESDMARELGLDVLNISPADLPTELFTGRFEDLLRGTEIEAGRYLGPRFFTAVQFRPTTQVRPGATVEYSTPAGYRWTTSFVPRFLSSEPTLRESEPLRASIFGVFMFREWRF